MVDISEVEVTGLGDVVYVCCEREGAVEDDTQTPNLRGGKNGAMSTIIEKLLDLESVFLEPTRRNSVLRHHPEDTVG